MWLERQAAARVETAGSGAPGCWVRRGCNSAPPTEACWAACALGSAGQVDSSCSTRGSSDGQAVGLVTDRDQEVGVVVLLQGTLSSLITGLPAGM